MSTIEQDIQIIRTGIYGKDVREAIADGIEKCYDDVATFGVSVSGTTLVITTDG